MPPLNIGPPGPFDPWPDPHTPGVEGAGVVDPWHEGVMAAWTFMLHILPFTLFWILITSLIRWYLFANGWITYSTRDGMFSTILDLAVCLFFEVVFRSRLIKRFWIYQAQDAVTKTLSSTRVSADYFVDAKNEKEINQRIRTIAQVQNLISPTIIEGMVMDVIRVFCLMAATLVILANIIGVCLAHSKVASLAIADMKERILHTEWVQDYFEKELPKNEEDEISDFDFDFEEASDSSADINPVVQIIAITVNVIVNFLSIPPFGYAIAMLFTVYNSKNARLMTISSHIIKQAKDVKDKTYENFGLALKGMFDASKK